MTAKETSSGGAARSIFFIFVGAAKTASPTVFDGATWMSPPSFTLPPVIVTLLRLMLSGTDCTTFSNDASSMPPIACTPYCPVVTVNVPPVIFTVVSNG